MGPNRLLNLLKMKAGARQTTFKESTMMKLEQVAMEKGITTEAGLVRKEAAEIVRDLQTILARE